MALAEESEDEVVLTGSPKILVADDEELMREVVCMMIEEAGGEVVEAANGQEAVNLFAEHHDSIECVFLDFSMPGLNGFEAYEQIRGKHSSVPVVIMSGLKITPEVENSWRSGDLDYLGKPFNEEVLLSVLKKKLSE